MQAKRAQRLKPTSLRDVAVALIHLDTAASNVKLETWANGLPSVETPRIHVPGSGTLSDEFGHEVEYTYERSQFVI